MGTPGETTEVMRSGEGSQLSTLVSYFQGYYGLEAKEEYIDLGTPMSVDAGSSLSFVSQCDSLLRAHPLGTSRIVVAIVDGGCKAPGAIAEDFGGRLHQIQGQDLVMSSHAVAVLWALIERLEHRGILDVTELYCALVAPEPNIGSTCFTHGNSPKMLSALQMLGSTLSASSLPTIINMSMGTHVGPHNGNSPLEYYVRTLPSPSARRYFFVPAGNDGQSGISASRRLLGGQSDFLRLRTQWPGANEILIEFWWSHAAGGDLTIEVEAQDEHGAPLIVAGSLVIDSASAAGVQMTQRTPPGPGYPAFSSLFHANCFNGMSCIAFGLTNPGKGSATILDFTLTSQRDAVVNAWIAISADKQAHFVGSNEASNLRVPSTLDELICVAGVDAARQPWVGSSRGPAATYGQPSQGSQKSPRMAHLVELGFEKGTSFASPRASADAAAVILNASGQLATSAQGLVDQDSWPPTKSIGMESPHGFWKLDLTMGRIGPGRLGQYVS